MIEYSFETLAYASLLTDKSHALECSVNFDVAISPYF